MISRTLIAEIRRLYELEGWRKGTIARHLGVHHSTVSRALERCSLSERARSQRRASMLDEYLPLVRATLERYPLLSAAQLYEMVKSRGYAGGPDHFRHRIADLGLRPKKAPEAFFELRTLPGEQAQVDWAHFGERRVEGGVRRLLAFVMVLSYSRRIFLRFFLDARMPSFLEGHVRAFDFWGGVVRQVLYDNLKSAVTERVGSAIRFHPRLLELADCYGYEPVPVGVRRGNEKGRVERAIRYVRSSFYPLRAELEIEALNREAMLWCSERTSQRPWPQDRRRSVQQAYDEERRSLLELPGDPFPTHEEVVVRLGKTPYVRFDTNRYSVPHDRIRRSLILWVETDRIRIFDHGELIAVHERCWGKQQVLEDPAHLAALAAAKRHARLHRNQHRLLRVVPLAEQLLVELSRRQRSLGTTVEQLLRLLEEFGTLELEAAITEALDRGSAHPETVRLILDRRHHQQERKPPIRVPLADARLRDLSVRPHSLDEYDDGEEE